MTISSDQYETDNRDLSTTWIKLPDGQVVEVLPWDLVRNCIENLTDDPDCVYLKRLSDLKKDLDNLLLDMMKD